MSKTVCWCVYDMHWIEVSAHSRGGWYKKVIDTVEWMLWFWFDAGRDKRIHGIKIDNSSFVRGGELKYLGTANQNSIHDDVKSRLKSGNACYHSVQNLLTSSLLSKNLKF